MSLMTREDMLRELELLPVWQLRAPLPSFLHAEVEAEALAQSVALPLIENQAIETEEIVTDTLEKENFSPATSLDVLSEPAPVFFTVILNDSADYLFVLPSAALQADEQHLLKNIFMAMRIKVQAAETSSNIVALMTTHQPKILIAMGESTAQAILQSSESLLNLRGKLHQFQNLPLVATYDLAHLLQVSADKALAWNDLCLAMHTLQQPNKL
jgi:DNA polymerase